MPSIVWIANISTAVLAKSKIVRIVAKKINICIFNMSTFGDMGKQVIQEEIRSLQKLQGRFDTQAFQSVVELILKHPGKVVFSGIGKSGYIARKLSSTFNSTGTRSAYLHPSEALHGDLGIYSAGDPTIFLSRSGSTQEILQLVPRIRQFKAPIIAMVGNLTSPLAQLADFVLDVSITKEADPLGFVPTSSTTLALVLGDALACTLMQARGFRKEDFLKFHPGGQLGKNLGQCVGDYTCPLKDVACVSKTASLRDIVIALTTKPLGAAFVMDQQKFLGLITDGDIRRCLQKGNTIENIYAQDIMTARPIKVYANLNLEEALQLMEDRPHQLSVLPVFNTDQTCRGLFRLHDAYAHTLIR